MTYSIGFWGSDRTLGNDDKWTGEDDLPSLEAAQRAFGETSTNPRFAEDWQYAYIDGPDGEIWSTVNPRYAPSEDEPDLEYAMQQGMGHGIDAYNEAKGENATERLPAPSPFR